MKLIGLDLDGSLLKNDQTISDMSVEILKKISSQGHKLVLTSGRSYSGILRYHEKLNLSTPIISLSGALITYPDGSHFKVKMCGNVINKMFRENKHILESMMLNNEHEIHSYRHNFETEKIFNGASSTSIKEFNINSSNRGFLGGVIIIKNENRDEFESYFKKISLKVRFWGSHGEYSFYDIHNKRASKAKALKEVLKYYELDNKSLITIGDGINDVEMISEANVGVAMKNGLDVVKKAANYITAHTNDNDGVALFLEDYLK